MSLILFLPDRLLAHVRHVFINEDLLTARSWDEINSLIRHEPVTALILDPSADGVMNLNAVVNLLKRYPSLPVVAYVVLNQESFGAVAQLSRQGLENVVLQRFEDSPARFREAVERAQGNPLKRKVLAALRARLTEFPINLVSTVNEMFELPHRFSSAQDVALKAEMSTIRLYRCFSAAGLCIANEGRVKAAGNAPFALFRFTTAVDASLASQLL